MRDCVMKESAFLEVGWRDWRLTDCVLEMSEWQRVPMKGLDLSACAFTALRVEPSALRGLKVTGVQAMALSRLLGLEIVE